MKLDRSIYLVASTTARPGWAVYRLKETQVPRYADRVWCYLDADPTNQPLTIPKGTIKLKTRSQHGAARCAAAFDVADRLLADSMSAAQEQRNWTFTTLINQYEIT